MMQSVICPILGQKAIYDLNVEWEGCDVGNLKEVQEVFKRPGTARSVLIL